MEHEPKSSPKAWSQFLGYTSRFSFQTCKSNIKIFNGLICTFVNVVSKPYISYHSFILFYFVCAPFFCFISQLASPSFCNSQFRLAPILLILVMESDNLIEHDHYLNTSSWMLKVLWPCLAIVFSSHSEGLCFSFVSLLLLFLWCFIIFFFWWAFLECGDIQFGVSWKVMPLCCWIYVT